MSSSLHILSLSPAQLLYTHIFVPEQKYFLFIFPFSEEEEEEKTDLGGEEDSEQGI